jgi:hypothetical protein
LTSAIGEQSALIAPRDREPAIVGEPIGGEIERVVIAEDRFDDIWREKAQSQDSGKVGSCDTGFRS